MKKIVLTTLILILVSCVLFVPVYLLLIHTTYTNAVDYSQDIQGEWSTYQYYHGKERVACNDDIWMTIEVVDDEITIKGKVLPEVKSNITWLNGTSFSYDSDGKSVTFYLSIEDNNLKITVADSSYIILLRRIER